MSLNACIHALHACLLSCLQLYTSSYLRFYLHTYKCHLCPSADSSMATDVGLCSLELPSGQASQVGSQLPDFGSAVFWRDYLIFVTLLVGLNVAVRLNATVEFQPWPFLARLALSCSKSVSFTWKSVEDAAEPAKVVRNPNESLVKGCAGRTLLGPGGQDDPSACSKSKQRGIQMLHF